MGIAKHGYECHGVQGNFVMQFIPYIRPSPFKALSHRQAVISPKLPTYDRNITDGDQAACIAIRSYVVIPKSISSKLLRIT